MRPIDADALKQDLTRFYDNEVTAKQLIDEQPTVSGWVSVKDRMPAEKQMVIGYTPVDGYMFIGYWDSYTFLGETFSNWHIITAMRSTKTMKKRVTHWLPLPEPPKEET